jgi:hypothetical protein
MPGVVWDPAVDLVPNSSGPANDWTSFQHSFSGTHGVSPWTASTGNLTTSPVFRWLVAKGDSNEPFFTVATHDIGLNLLLQGGLVFKGNNMGTAIGTQATWTHGTAVPAPSQGTKWRAWDISGANVVQVANSPAGNGFAAPPLPLNMMLLTPEDDANAGALSVADSFFAWGWKNSGVLWYAVGGLA